MLAIIGGKIITVSSGPIENGIILVEEGKIVDVGIGLSIPEGAEVIDASDKVIMPGIVEAQSRIAIIEEGVGAAGNDIDEATDPSTPHIRAIDGVKVNADEGGLVAALEAGVTTVQILPGGSNVIAGQAFVMKTAPKVTPDEMALKLPSGMKVNLTDSPQRRYGGMRKAPSSKMGVVNLLRKQLLKAKHYMIRLEGDKKPDRDLRMEALVPVLKGDIPLLVHAHRADDITSGVRVCEEFGVRMVLHYATEGHRVAELLAERGIPVVHGNVFNIQPRSWEKRELCYETAKILMDAGCKVAVTMDAMSQVVRLVLVAASFYVKHGMSYDAALRSITLTPAEIMGVDDRVGSIERGKDADLRIVTGDPLSIHTKVSMVLVEGEVLYEA